MGISNLKIKKIIENSVWLLVDKLLRLITGFLTGVLVARYLGPNDYGILSYAFAFISILYAFASLGLGDILVRELVVHKEDAGELLGSSFAMLVASGLLTYIVLIGIGFLIIDDESRLVVFIVGISLMLRPVDVIKYWFESRVESKKIIAIELSVSALIMVIKLFLILIEAGLMMFALASLFEAVLVVAGYCFVWRRYVGSFSWWSVKNKKALYLIRESLPLIFSGALVLLNLNIDKLILNYYWGGQEVGLYSAAHAFIAPWYFIPVAIIGSIVPRLVELNESNRNEYDRYCKLGYKVILVSALLISSVISIFSSSIVEIAYGGKYEGAAQILIISVWALVFVFQVSFRGRLLVIEGIQYYVLRLVTLGFIFNLLFNLLLIPNYGGVGAACAYTMSWALAALLLPLASNKLEHHFWWSLGIGRNKFLEKDA